MMHLHTLFANISPKLRYIIDIMCIFVAKKDKKPQKYNRQ